MIQTALSCPEGIDEHLAQALDLCWSSDLDWNEFRCETFSLL
jgi:hypothetical protein